MHGTLEISLLLVARPRAAWNGNRRPYQVDHAPRILVIDDEDEIRTFFSQILLEKGYHVTAVATAGQALRALRSLEFELVVLDLSLPDGDGLEVTRQIRCEIPHLHILAISGFMVGDMPLVAIAAGASATLQKPTTASALRWKVSELVA
jgi:two-component system phosphate regulon response regulator OmpR